MTAYYNEIDPKAAAWIRELIKQGHVAQGEVDERSIVDVRGSDLAGFTQCHFFAGIGVWSHALRSAGWADERPVWTGSCPCQSFSAAGSGRGFDDERHLWPHFFRLIQEQRPGTVFGEQVASKDGLAWLDFVCADMESEGYAIAPLDLCAAGFGAPHVRQRLFFVADSRYEQRGRWAESKQSSLAEVTNCGKLGKPNAERLERSHSYGGISRGVQFDPPEPSSFSDLGYADSRGSAARLARSEPGQGGFAGVIDDSSGEGTSTGQRSATNGFWSDANWLPCRDGKARPVEPGTFPLAHGAAERVGRLRGYGNAIVAPVATEFIKAYIEERGTLS